MIPAEKVQRMYADYTDGMSQSAVALKYGHERRGLAEIFLRRGLALRPCTTILKRRRLNGRLLPDPRKTPAEITALIHNLTRLHVPAAIKYAWRLWPMDRRVEFIRRARAHLVQTGRLKSVRPSGPFSANVIPFEYGSPEAIAIEARVNAGTNSRTKRIKIKPSSQGVIWKDQLFFWNQDGYQSGGGWRPKPGQSSGRPFLHHHIWEETNGRKIPAAHTVIAKDGNKNNLAPANLVLRSMADCARINRVRARLRASRSITALLLKRHQQQDPHENLSHLNSLRQSRRRKGFARKELAKV